ncbi:unnamed protein product [Symbiodinium sp. CCMP2592]|nr:unnamed protein product [Symbiodinium sp. CCMP2592]
MCTRFRSSEDVRLHTTCGRLQRAAAVSSLLSAFDVALFARSCTTSAELEELVNHFLAEASVTDAAERFITKASLRLLFCKCRTSEGMASLEAAPTPITPLGEGPPAATPAPPATPPLSSSWQEAWPAKLSGERTAALRKRFEEDYPTELLDAESFPSARLLALTNKMLSDKEVRWIPWKYRLSARAQEDSLLVRPRKQARFDLTELFLDEAPTRDIHEGPASFGLVTQLLSLAANAIALCQGAHLGSLKLYNKRFMRICFTKYEAAASLRGPTTMEAQAADRRCWEIIADLVNVHHWKLDDALHEVAEVRSDMHSLLAPRPFIPKPKFDLDNSWKARFTGNGRGGKGGGRGGKGREGKGEKGDRFERGGKGGKGKDNKQVPEWAVQGPGDMPLLAQMRSAQETHFSEQRDIAEEVTTVPLSVPAQPSGSAGATSALPKARAPVSDAASALSEGSLDFATCLELLAQYFSIPFASSSHCPDNAIAASEAYFNLGAFAFDNGARRTMLLELVQVRRPVGIDCLYLQELGNPQSIPPPLKDTTCVELFLDICCGEQLDLLNDDTYDHLLRLCFAGIVRLAHGSPPCKEYSRLKLRPGGPPAIRSPDHLNGLPGAHVSLEQPTNAMSWLEPFVQAHVRMKEATSPSQEETEWLRSSFKRFSDAHSPCQDWNFSVKEGQPYCLSALERLSTMLGDKDTSLFPALQKGVPTGFDGDIPRSHTLRPRDPDNSDEPTDLLVCEGNWQRAEADPALLQELIEEEVSAGYIEEVPSLEAAYERWGKERVAVGRVNIVKAPGRSARLVIDNSICNTNQNCHVPEQFSLPSLQDIQAAYPPREDEEPVSGFSLDVKGVHKTSLVREQDRGLLGLRQQERLFFYHVCPFGATFSSHWFARLGGFFVRCLHLLIWLSHVLMLYVDDLLLWQNSRALPLSASLVLAFCACFNIPLSWRKLQMGPSITWIGWQIDFKAGCYTLPELKRLKLLGQVEECLRHRLVSRKQLDKLLGLLQWILHGLPALRPWLCTLYDDMHRPLGTNVSISPVVWPGIHSYLDDKLRFTGSPPGTGISPGSTLLSARHKLLKSKEDLALVPVSTKRMWLRVTDPTSSKRRLSESSRETLAFFAHLSSRDWRPRPLRPPPTSSVESAADAFGKGNDCGVGGWLLLPSGRLLWFAHRYTVKDFLDLGLPMQADANLDISSYETLAQCFVLLAFWKAHVSGRLALTLPALSDNSGAESVCNKLYTSKVPLNLFVRKLSMWSSITGVTLDCSHIAGEKNDDADLLSRWDGSADLPAKFLASNRIELSLSEFWQIRFQVTLFPADTFLKWQLPSADSLGPTNRGSRKRK